VLAWWRAADKRQGALIMATRATACADDVEALERRKDRLRKPGRPR
jgi:hypothetical protein